MHIRFDSVTGFVLHADSQVYSRFRAEQSITQANRRKEMRLGKLSEKYEGGGAGTISTGEGDAGGVSYGTYQLASGIGNVTPFVDWLLDHPEYAGIGAILQVNNPGTMAFSNDWTYCADTYPDQFAQAQDEYVKPRFYDAAIVEMQKVMDIAESELPDALKCVLFSNAIQHGPYWAGRLVGESYDPNPATWITKVYDTKLRDMSWSSGAPTLRPGLFSRWESEKQDAIAMLA
jgi:hypothetical protein